MKGNPTALKVNYQFNTIACLDSIGFTLRLVSPSEFMFAPYAKYHIHPSLSANF